MKLKSKSLLRINSSPFAIPSSTIEKQVFPNFFLRFHPAKHMILLSAKHISCFQNKLLQNYKKYKTVTYISISPKLLLSSTQDFLIISRF